MRRRQLSIFTLVAALFLSAWAQVFAASSCPRMRQDYGCCRARAAHSRERHETACGASHEMSSGMRMTTAAESSQGAKVFAIAEGSDGEVTEACDHCASRSSEPSLAVVLSLPKAKNRNSELAPHAAATTSSELTQSYLASILSKSNSPPVTSTARHVLFSLFRI